MGEVPDYRCVRQIELKLRLHSGVAEGGKSPDNLPQVKSLDSLPICSAWFEQLHCSVADLFN